MKKDDTRRSAEDPAFIPGIYNYCDRWCERCAFTSRCMTYALNKGQAEALDDLHNAHFWRSLSDVLKVTCDVLADMAAARGLDLNTLAVEETAEQARIALERASIHPCCTAAFAYARHVDGWFTAAAGSLVDRMEVLDRQEQSGMPNPGSQPEAAQLTDAVEIIRWYQHQIYVKLIRAVEGAEQGGAARGDAEGSAKVALLAMDRSIAAWSLLYRHFPERQDEILFLLLRLGRLRRETERVFPDARSFLRPGFDDWADAAS